MLTRPTLSRLFKCMSADCSFSSDRPAVFRQHLAAAHSPADREAGLCCCCGGRLRSAGHLVGHIVARHGHSGLQCPYCFFRADTRLAVMVHQTVHHKSLSRGDLTYLVLHMFFSF